MEVGIMRIVKEQVLRIAQLAKLAVNDAELDSLLPQLQEFLDYAEVLARIKLEKTELIVGMPISYAEPVEQCHLTQGQVLALAPDSFHGLIRVPRVIDNE